MAETEEELKLWKKWMDIKAFFKRKEEQWQMSSLAMRFYVGGLIALSLSILVILVGGPKDFFQCVFTLAFVSITLGFLVETYLFIMKALATTFGKVFAAFFLALAIALANGIAQVVINHATGVDPVYFSGTRAFVTPLMVLYFVLMGSLVLFFISICYVLLAAAYDATGLWFVKRNTIQETKQQSRLRGHGLRFFGAFGLLSISLSGWSYIQKPYEHGLETTAAWFTYTFEMFPDQACFADKTIHIKRINDRLVLAGESKNGMYVFQTAACPIDPASK